MPGRSIAFIALILVLAPLAAHAGWIPNGVPVCNLPGDQRYPTVISDGNGGANLAWVDLRNGTYYQLFAQHVDRFGIPTATKGGVQISTANTENLSLPQAVVSDGSTGIFVAWSEAATLGAWRVHVQWFSANTPMWGPGGVAVCTTAAVQSTPTLVRDGAGGVIVVWEDFRSASSLDLYAQRVSAAGARVWAATGVPVCTRSNNQTQQRLISDGANGAIVVWKDERAPLVYSDLYAQRLLGASGAPSWALNGIPICAAANPQFNPEIVSDGAGGAIIGWDDERTNGVNDGGYFYDVYAQRVNSIGAIQWVLDGVPLSPSERCVQYSLDEPFRMVADGEGGAIACWLVNAVGGPSGIRAQKLDGDGNRVWGIQADLVVPVISGVTFPYERNLVPDGAGGAFLTWHDTLLGGNYGGIRGQHLDRYGLKLWNPEDVDIFWSGSVLDFAMDGDSNGLMVATAEYREGAVGGYGDLFLQRVELAHGVTGRPEPLVSSAQDVPGDQGGFVALDWWASDQDTPGHRNIDHYSLWRSVNSGPPPAALVDARSVKSGQRGPVFTHFAGSEFYWELAGTEPAVGNPGYSYAVPTRADDQPGQSNGHFFRILAHDTDDMVFASSVAYASSIDNLAPAAPVQLSAQRVGNDVVLKWKHVAKKEPDLKQYALYRATSAGVQPAPINLVSTPVDTVYTDASAPAGTLYYIVTAVDVHTNQSTPSNEAAVSGVTGVSGSVPPATLSLLDNVPNPFSAATELRIGLPHPADVTLDVYDVAGRRVVSHTYPRMARGWQRIMFDARDAAGGGLPAGVYFYKVRAGAETRTRKMVITH
jgi:FlgD Ig-like domain